MSCFFCQSFNHLSQNCDIYFSDHFRANYLQSRNYCHLCLADKTTNYGLPWCTECIDKRKCYICFLRDHHTVFCPDRLNVQHFFLPKIDKDLLQRFMQILDLEEQYSLVFSTAEVLKSKSWKLTVVENETGFDKERDSNYVITQSFNYLSKTYLPPLKSVIFKCKTITIKAVSLSSNEFLQLLSIKLINLDCDNVTLSSTLTFSSIIKRSPNIEILYLNRINIAVGNLWPDDIIKWIKRKTLSLLFIAPGEIDFDVESLVTVFKEKSKKVVHIILDISNHFNDPENGQKILDEIAKKLSTNFYPGKYCHEMSMVEIRLPVRTNSLILFPRFLRM